MKKIPLTQGKYALVDDEDFVWLSKYRWHAYRATNGKFYAMRNGPKVNGKQKSIYMHREILGTPNGLVTDHIDQDGLNNQKSNLRTATHSQNLMNRGRPVSNTSGFKGVYRYHKKWRAQIMVNKRQIHIGLFTSRMAAHREYIRMSKKLHGKFSSFNSNVKTKV